MFFSKDPAIMSGSIRGYFKRLELEKVGIKFETRQRNGYEDDIPPGVSRRKWLFIKQGGICHYCTRPIEWEKWTVEHRTPRSRGGKGDPQNLVGACSGCNNRKGSQTEEEFRARGCKKQWGRTDLAPLEAPTPETPLEVEAARAQHAYLQARLKHQQWLRQNGFLCQARKPRRKQAWWFQHQRLPNPVIKEIAAECQNLV